MSGDEEEQISETYEEIEKIKDFSDARAAAKRLLKEKSKSQKYINAVDALLSRVGIVSIVTDRFNINNIKSDRLINPLAMQEFVRILQNRINEIASNYDKYINILKIRELGQFKDARMEDNAIKLATKIKALEIDTYLNISAEELAVKLVKGEWEWP